MKERGPDCPHCDGTGKKTSFAFLNRGPDWRDHTQEWIDTDCQCCAGHGHLAQWVLDQIANGKSIRKEREKRGENLLDAGKRLGISSAEMSSIEWGRKPMPETEAGE